MYLSSPFPTVPPLPQTNFHNVIWKGPAAADIPDHVVQIDGITGQKRTRSEFIERMYDGATALGTPKQAGGLGLTPDDVVGILSDNCLEYIALVHSLLVITTPFAVMSSYATRREIVHSLMKSKATHMFVHANLLPVFLPIALVNNFPEDRIYILEGTPVIGSHLQSFGQMIDKVRRERIPRVPIRDAGSDTLAYLVFSSGTSGLPKAVMISHGSLIFSCIQGAMIFQETSKLMPPPNPDFIPVVLSFLPFSHSYGLNLSVLRAQLRPGTHVIMPRWNINLGLKLISKYRVTSLPSVPSIIHQLANSPQFAKMDISSITSIASGAAHLPQKLREKFLSMIPQGISMLDAYGMSEATLSIIVHPAPGFLGGSVECIPEATGILCAGVEAMILRPDGTHCLPGEPGELYVKGRNVALGYWKDEEATKETFLDGWMRTGDIFRANNKGTFWFEDRAKDTLKISGLQVSPAEIEDLLFAEPRGLVIDVAVAGVRLPTARTSDELVPRGWIVLSEHGRQMREQVVRDMLEQWTRENLSKYKWLRGGIEFVEEIPKNSSGKVLRRVLQDRFASKMSSRTKL